MALFFFSHIPHDDSHVHSCYITAATVNLPISALMRPNLLREKVQENIPDMKYEEEISEVRKITALTLFYIQIISPS